MFHNQKHNSLIKSKIRQVTFQSKQNSLTLSDFPESGNTNKQTMKHLGSDQSGVKLN